MKVKSVYAKLEKVIYEFEESDIKDALLNFIRLEKKEGQKVEIDWNQYFDYPVTATVTIINEENKTEEDDV